MQSSETYNLVIPLGCSGAARAFTLRSRPLSLTGLELGAGFELGPPCRPVVRHFLPSCRTPGGNRIIFLLSWGPIRSPSGPWYGLSLGLVEFSLLGGVLGPDRKPGE